MVSFRRTIVLNPRDQWVRPLNGDFKSWHKPSHSLDQPSRPTLMTSREKRFLTRRTTRVPLLLAVNSPNISSKRRESCTVRKISFLLRECVWPLRLICLLTMPLLVDRKYQSLTAFFLFNLKIGTVSPRERCKRLRRFPVNNWWHYQSRDNLWPQQPFLKT